VTDDRLLPLELRQAIDAASVGVSISDLRAAAVRLSIAYRGGRAVSPKLDDLAALAYAATRMPATFAAIRAVFHELRERCAGLRVETLLDFGAGPATTLWAASLEFSQLARVRLIERDPAMKSIGQRLLEHSLFGDRVEATWHTAVDASLPPVGHDLVVIGYLLTELSEDVQREVLHLAWQACRGAVVVVLPGSTLGFRKMLEARRELVSLGASVVAPCPHENRCPLPDDDWCHFGVRLNRSSLHRRLKEGALAYEDEKYCYVIATRGAGHPAPGRLIRRPLIADRRVTLRVCGVDGIREQVMTRRDRTTYRRARKARWGETWD
jgi:ribosomal protein RSM22 (predicted rRNA methylase)